MSMVAMLTMTAGQAKGQVGIGGDPTPINSFSCKGVFVPPMSPAYAGSNPSCYPATRDPNYGPFSLTWTNSAQESWIVNTQTMGATSSPRDRRPAFFLQCWNGLWVDNPYGLNDWWAFWRQNPQTGQWEDAPRDQKSLNPATLEWTANQANGVPDQFEELYFRYKTMYDKGIRRFILKLPGGVPFGKAMYQYVGNTRYDFYGGHNQPMNQWGMMPQWKKEWFLGHKIDANGNNAGPLEDLRYPGQNIAPSWMPWQTFANIACDADCADNKLKLEIYVGFNIQSGTCTPCEDTNPWSSGTYFKNPTVGGVPTGVTSQGEFTYDPYWFTGCNSEAQSIDPDPRKQIHMNHIDQAVSPWHAAGIRRVWFDTGADNADAPGRRKRFAFLNLAHCPQYMGFWGNQQSHYLWSHGGEALPFSQWSETDPILDDCALTYAPWCALSPMFMSWTPGTGGPYGTGRAFYPSIQVNPDLTEVHMLVNPYRTGSLNNTTVQEPELCFDEFGAIRERGFVISVYNFYNNNSTDASYYERLLNRWYSMGRILLPDFDGNGVVNQADHDRAYAAMHPTAPPSRYVVATGNVYPVGSSEQVVDQNDWDFWLAAWNSYQQGNHTGPTVEFDYGYAKTANLR